MTFPTRSVVLVALTALSGAASAQQAYVSATSDRWAGWYAGVNAGAAISTTCNTWTTNGGPGATFFNNQNCPNKSTFVGGVQIGYDFQVGDIVWGFGLDYDFYSAKTKNKSLTSDGSVFPPGTYDFNGKNSPSGFAILGPRVGYAIDNWLPYVRAGGVFASGSTNSTVTYTDPGGQTATFNGGKNYNSHGYGFGLGVDYALPEKWSLRAEYTYVNLGKGSNTTTTCTAGANVCNNFAALSLDSIHNSLTFSVIRIGVNYEF